MAHARSVERDPVVGSPTVVDRAIDVSRLEAGDERAAADVFAEITALTAANRAAPDRDVERRLLRLRHDAGVRLAREQGARGVHPTPDLDPLPEADGLPDFTPADVTPERLRAAILRDGCMVVRGLVARDTATAFAAEIERAYAERERKDAGGTAEPGYYEEFRVEAPFKGPIRPWIKEGGGLLAADSPKLAFQMMEMFDTAGIPALVAGYLGEPAAISLHKTTLRKVEPTVVGAWHQDGAFMGDVRSVNLWLSLSHCGDVAPGLDIVPRRLDSLVATGTDGAFLADQVSQATAEEAAGDQAIVRPVFEPGDAVIFDELCLHQTGADPSMPDTRYAIECWFFGGSAFPASYAPLAV
jgi:Phytanoyl-CoA dioxygenase (PhyH)